MPFPLAHINSKRASAISTDDFCFRFQIQTENNESEFLCQQCIYQIKFAYNVRCKIIETMSSERHYTFEIYKIISNDDELNIVSADTKEATQLAEQPSEAEFMVQLLDEEEEVDEVEVVEELEKFGEPIQVDSSQEDGAEDAVSFLLNKKELFQKKKPPPAAKEERPHVCQVCQKSFGRKSNLVDHLRLHANVRPYKCEYCEKTFVQPGNYRSHLRIHTKERPYECSICGKNYNQPNALKVINCFPVSRNISPESNSFV